MDNQLGRTTFIPRRSASAPAPAPDVTPLSPSSSSCKAVLYPIPNVQPTNMVKLKHTGDIEETWAIDSRMKIPRNALQLKYINHISFKPRANVDLHSERGGIAAQIYILPCFFKLFSNTQAITIRVKFDPLTNPSGDIRLTVLDARDQAKGKLTRRFGRRRPPLDIECHARFGNATIALPRSFRGSIHCLNGRFEYSTGIKAQLAITTADDNEHRGFIGAPVKGTKDKMEVDCSGRIYVCYDYEELGAPAECENQ